MRSILVETHTTNENVKTNIITYANPAIKAFGSYPKGDKGDTFLVKDHAELKTLADRINHELARPLTVKDNLFEHPVSTIDHITLTLL